MSRLGREGKRSSTSPARRRVKRTVQLLLFALVFNFLVLPQLARLGDAIVQLTSVKSSFLVIGLGLQLGAFVCYSQLTRVALPPGSISLTRTVRIQFSTRAVASIVPGGSAASSALGYRLLTLSGVDGADSGFALATVSLGSAVLLNIILWTGLLISIPVRGFNPLYVTAAVIGVFLIGVFFGIVISLRGGREQTLRVVRAIARRVHFLDEDRAARVVDRLAERLQELLSDRELLRRIALWGTLNWLLDAASLWIFLYAYGGTLSLDGLLVAFGLANVFAAVPITPGGIGIVEGVYIPTLVAFGVPASTVAIGVPTYRLAQFWLPMIIGAFSYVTLRVGPFSIPRGEQRLERFRDVAVEAIEHPGESGMEWAERYGHRPPRREPGPWPPPSPGWPPPPSPG